MINTFQVNFIDNPKTNKTYYIDYQNTDDPVLFWFDLNLGYGKLENADTVIREESNQKINIYKHRSPIDSGKKFWETLDYKIKYNSSSTK